jgi:alginate O-acetyltransferase complex protein AlgI
VLFNYIIGISLSRPGEHRKTKTNTLLIIGVASNVLLLGYFKYADFFILNINFALTSKFPLLDIGLPLGISFFTFTQIAYLVDSYRGNVKEYDFLNYALFVTFFPHLLAGPIIHHKEMMPQFSNYRNKSIHYTNISNGLFLFSIGLFKKVIIADPLGVWATNGFDHIQALSFIEAWATSLSYTFQLYYDFSAYTDMAIGGALFFNIKLPINFNSPYRATNIQDFWRRWHITLSRFLRDYVYIPLGGNRKGGALTGANLMATFVIGGIWHGAGWTFIFWGFLHGVAIVIHRIWRQFNFELNQVIAWILTFNFVNLGWIFFRAREWKDAIKVLKGMFGFEGIVLPHKIESLLGGLSLQGVRFGDPLVVIGATNMIYIQLAMALGIALMLKSSQFSLKLRTSFIGMMFSAVIFFVALTYMGGASEFLYFNF